MASIVALAGSNSSVSINFQLVNFTVNKVQHKSVKVLNLADFPFPMYSYDEEKNNGHPTTLVRLKNDLLESDGLILSVNEHNGQLSAYFKNVLDWLSRLERGFLNNKKIFLMATSTGKLGGSSALNAAASLLPRFGGEIVATFSLPSFSEHFDSIKGITNDELRMEHETALSLFLSKL